MEKTRYFCECGSRAVVEEADTDEASVSSWYCLRCALNQMVDNVSAGVPVTISFGARGISDLLLVPPDDRHEPDLLAPLVGAVAIRFCRN